MSDKDERIALLTEGILRECRLYIMAHSSTEDTLSDVLKAIALTHLMLLASNASLVDAIAAERERCAKIARSFVDWPYVTDAGIKLANAIADAINLEN